MARVADVLHNPRFSAYANLCGGHGYRVTEPAALKETLQEAISHDGPTLVEVVTNAELI